MINIYSLLRDSLNTFKINFAKIFNMSWPIVLLTILADYSSFQISTKIRLGTLDIPYFALAFMVYLISILLVGLFLSPALNMVVQKNEDVDSFDIKQAYDFQKKNIWKFVKVNLWALVYFLKYTWIYIVVSISLLIIAETSNDSRVVFTLAYSALAIILIGGLLNITKFMFYKNIFFSKDDVSPKDIVKESILLGESRKMEIWKIIFSIIIVTASIEFILYILNLIIKFEKMSLIIVSLVSMLIYVPYIYILVAKGYVKLRGVDVPLPMEGEVEVKG